ncbi:hypothetical protein FDP41_003378 [Naegleria fowleri]|uniref:Uncharacterized protein n=1 Tax=Naegleria fowleri TaxID=5763 RepID=A0A6A5BQN2_NAEFO|nr:uncharacterized protein FDP41_003378 [Naegleria fowleri]KAF0977386.1 hypothetical protein FDP41_003378 [Naegleria fowleri]CAG4719541.1 unnamed protein product [Naegleria fowleri]
MSKSYPPQSSHIPPDPNMERPILNWRGLFDRTKRHPRTTVTDRNLAESDDGKFSLPIRPNEYKLMKQKYFNDLLMMIKIKNCWEFKDQLLEVIEKEKENYPNDLVNINLLKSYLQESKVDSNFLDYFGKHVLLKQPEQQVLHENILEEPVEGKAQSMIVGEDFSQYDNHKIYSLYAKYHNCMQYTFLKIITIESVLNCKRPLAEYRALPLHFIQFEKKTERYWKKYERCVLKSAARNAYYTEKYRQAHKDQISSDM